jgi:putative flippase GtrA
MGKMMKTYYKKIFIDSTDNTIIQLFRYTFVGGFAFIVDFGLLIFLTEIIGYHYLLSAAISFTIGLFVNYLLSIMWVFSNSKYHNRIFEIIIFTIIGIIGLGINEIVLYVLTGVLQLTHYIVSKLASTIIVYGWNFFARKYILFNIEGKND